MHLLNTLIQADKARRWTGRNTTIGTGIAVQNTNTFDETKFSLAIFNQPLGSNTQHQPPARLVVPDYIKLITTAIGIGNPKLAITLDYVDEANGFPTPRGLSGNVGVVLANADSDSLGTTGIANVQFKSGTTGAAGSAVRAFIANDYLKNGALVAGDEICITFNEPAIGLTGQASRILVPVGLTTIGQGGIMLVHIYNMTGAPSFELEMGWWELS